MRLSWQLPLVYYPCLSTAFAISSLRPRWSYVTSPQDLTCGLSSANLINSTGTNSTLNPFILPKGSFNTTDRNWTWTLATTTTGPDKDTVDTVQQKLFLSVQPAIDLSSSNLTPQSPGCGVIFHGLNHAALVRGQSDSGSCTHILSSHCVSALQSQTTNFDRHCNWNSSANPLIPPECSDYFNPNTVVQTFTFASSNTSQLCSFSQSRSSSSSSSSNSNSNSKQSLPPGATLVSSWASSPFIHNNTFISPQGLSRSPYDNLTTLISPIMVHLGQGPGHLFCIRSRDVVNGSLVPTRVPGYSEGPWWALPVEMLVFAVLVGAALM